MIWYQAIVITSSSGEATMYTLAFFNLPGGTEWLIIGLVALLFFGRKLPDVARSMGRSIVEFKKGLRDIKDDVDAASREADSSKPLPPPPPENKPSQSTPE
ncbi:MAG: Sec-independent protein translocase protein TatA [Phycisphaerae bacterium]|nr:Sec-independent protein translocase protein TatA [Phycisphaerae bacterium]